jgi:hypothetical protein
MSEPYSFVYDGHTVVYKRATVASRLEADRLIVKLRTVYGYTEANSTPADEWDNFYEYANSMARATTDAPWYAHSNMPHEDIKTRFELFLNEEGDLYNLFAAASHAASQQKKMKT